MTQTEDILNSILPPREWTEDGQLWVQVREQKSKLDQTRTRQPISALRSAVPPAQYVSSTPATRLDVINLQEKLDQQLQQRQARARSAGPPRPPLRAPLTPPSAPPQARETGICPVREELYAQCFGAAPPPLLPRPLPSPPPLPRARPLNAPPNPCRPRRRAHPTSHGQLRGARARPPPRPRRAAHDHRRLPGAAHPLRPALFINISHCRLRGQPLASPLNPLRPRNAQTLYESAVAFGIRKALQTEQGKSDLEARVHQLEGENQELERQLAEWKNKCEMIEKRESERRAQDDKKHAEEARPRPASAPPAAASRAAKVPAPRAVEARRLLLTAWPAPSSVPVALFGAQVAFLTRQNKQLKAQLEAFLAPAKK